jgi:threonine aldolase
VGHQQNGLAGAVGAQRPRRVPPRSGQRLAQPGVQTNIVIVDVAGVGVDPLVFVHDLEKVGVLSSHFGGSLVRFVTHYGIERPGIEEAVAGVHHVMASRSS